MNVAIVAAAGQGARLGSAVAKPYIPIAGRAMLLRTLDRVAAARSIQTIILVAAASEIPRCAAILAGDPLLRQRAVILQAGGATRQESVRNGLEKVPMGAEIVVIHDAARPLVSPALIDRCVEAAQAQGAAVVGLPVRDTIKAVSVDRRVQGTPERNSLWAIQTPQAFRREWIVAAHERAAAEPVEATDDAMLLERMGRPVLVIEGEATNIKITVPEDLWLAEMLIRERRLP
jgi:2-C-methyl-D-erythritol 4-phosphate cytidylyltransferase